MANGTQVQTQGGPVAAAATASLAQALTPIWRAEQQQRYELTNSLGLLSTSSGSPLRAVGGAVTLRKAGYAFETIYTDGRTLLSARHDEMFTNDPNKTKRTDTTFSSLALVEGKPKWVPFTEAKDLALRETVSYETAVQVANQELQAGIRGQSPTSQKDAALVDHYFGDDDPNGERHVFTSQNLEVLYAQLRQAHDVEKQQATQIARDTGQGVGL